MQYFLPYGFFILLVGIFFGCQGTKAYVLSEKHLQHEQNKGRAQEIAFNELPYEVEDTITGTFEREIAHSKEHPEDFTTTFPRQVSFDSTATFNSLRAEGSYEQYVMSGGRREPKEYFKITNREFMIPADEQIIFKVVYHDTLYLMGKALSDKMILLQAGNKIIMSTDPELHQFWAVPLWSASF